MPVDFPRDRNNPATEVVATTCSSTLDKNGRFEAGRWLLKHSLSKCAFFIKGKTKAPIVGQASCNKFDVIN